MDCIRPFIEDIGGKMSKLGLQMAFYKELRRRGHSTLSLPKGYFFEATMRRDGSVKWEINQYRHLINDGICKSEVDAWEEFIENEMILE